MSNLHIVTDSAASLPAQIVGDLPLTILPMWVQLPDRSLREGVDIDSARLYDLQRQGVLLTTSQPSPGDFLEIFKPLVKQGKQVIAVLVTSKASGTCASAQMAAEMLPEGAVTIFDSATTAMGTGFQALAAAEAVQAGKTREEVLSLLEQVRASNRVYFALPTLQHLRRSGRVSLAQALLGGLLNIKVVLTAEDGLVVVSDKARSWQGAVNKMEALVMAAAEAGPLALAVQHTGVPDQAQELYERLQGKVAISRGFINELSASLAVHGGPGMLGVAFCSAHLLEQN
ncbi:MAG TPA: DegV family protein [Firmicutes bacterium]|nr:DegV family protein [Bacillota bacterium]